MFANTQMMGMDLGFPDVCLTPTPAGPVPIPYPNIALGPTAIPSQVNTLFMCTPAHNLATVIPLTNGDNAGVATGVASGTVMGPSRHILPCATVLVGGVPATRLTSVSIQNNTNCPGVRIVPSQVKVILLAP
ncbi:MAG: type secretion protein [Myxococcaceae bacterium]|nr:type secretion protein [Myxococcaceae bacterium]